MNKPDVKKLILLNLPYVFAFYFADKIAAVFRLAPGTAFIDRLTNGFAVFGTAFANPLPSFHPVDLLIGVLAGALLKLAVYVKGKNRKKFRQGEEYGSARWGKPEDIKPYMDPEFSNNVILTQTEFLTMNSRPKQPKYGEKYLRTTAIPGGLRRPCFPGRVPSAVRKYRFYLMEDGCLETGSAFRMSRETAVISLWCRFQMMRERHGGRLRFQTVRAVYMPI